MRNYNLYVSYVVTAVILLSAQKTAGYRRSRQVRSQALLSVISVPTGDSVLTVSRLIPG
jgi:hypothetical protein